MIKEEVLISFINQTSCHHAIVHTVHVCFSVACVAGARRGKGRGIRAKREKRARSARAQAHAGYFPYSVFPFPF